MSANELLIAPGQGEETDAGMLIKVRAGTLGNDFSIMEGTIEPKQLLAPHSHDHEDQVVFIIQGELEFEVGGSGGTRFSAGAGSYVIKPRGLSHGFWNAKDTPVRYIELSGRDGFENFVDSTADGAVQAAIKAPKKFGITFHVQHIPRLMAKHGLTSVKGMSPPWKSSAK